MTGVQTCALPIYYYIDVEASLEYIDYLVQDNIIVAPTPTGNQAFRLENPTKKTNKISVRGWHVFYDSENLLIEDSYVVDKNCNDALDHLNNATSDTSPFTTISDITSTNSYRCVRKSFYEAVKVVIERWGGHLVRDNFSIGIREKIGNDNGVTIRRKKNMQDITCEENWNNVVTKLLPVGKDGLLLPEKYVNADFSYHIPYTKTQSFQQDIDENDYKDSNGDLNEEESSLNALLPYVLKRGCRLCSDSEAISKYLENLYGAGVGVGVLKRGDDHILHVAFETISDKYAPNGEKLCDSVIDLMLSIMFESTSFSDEIVEQEKKNAKDRIMTMINDKRQYAVERCIETMFEGENYAISKLGTQEGIDKITADNLKKHYENIITSSIIDIYICGDADANGI